MSSNRCVLVIYDIMSFSEVFLRSSIDRCCLRKILTLISWKAGHQHRKCSVVSSSSPHASQIGSDITPILHRWLRSLLWPVKIPITWRSFVRSRLSRYLDKSPLGALMKNFVWRHVVRLDQYFVCSSKIHLLIFVLAILVDTGIEGAGPQNCKPTPSLARLSAISFPIMFSWPGTQSRVIGTIWEMVLMFSLHSWTNFDVDPTRQTIGDCTEIPLRFFLARRVCFESFSPKTDLTIYDSQKNYCGYRETLQKYSPRTGFFGESSTLLQFLAKNWFSYSPSLQKNFRN